MEIYYFCWEHFCSTPFSMVYAHHFSLNFKIRVVNKHKSQNSNLFNDNK